MAVLITSTSVPDCETNSSLSECTKGTKPFSLTLHLKDDINL